MERLDHDEQVEGVDGALVVDGRQPEETD
jgi:hypothetical protein